MPSITSERAATYQDTGYLHLPGLIEADEIAAVASAIDLLPQHCAHLFDEKNARFQFANGAVWKYDPVIDLCPEIAALAHHPRLVAVLRDIFDGHEPSLFKDKLILKPAGTRGNELHQDYTWWQGFPINLVTLTISIDAGTHENGCTQIYPGMHGQGLLHAADKMEFLADAAVAGHTPEYFTSQPGDVALFHCFTPHRAGENRSAAPRRQLFLTYNDARDGDLYAAHYRHFLAYSQASGGSHVFHR